MIDKTINLLGLEAKDKITGISGIITSVSFELFGCVQAWLTRGVGTDGKVPDGQWFDVQRLETSGERTMPVPDFGSLDKTPDTYDSGPENKGPPSYV